MGWNIDLIWSINSHQTSSILYHKVHLFLVKEKILVDRVYHNKILSSRQDTVKVVVSMGVD